MALLQDAKLGQLASMRVCLDNVVASLGHILETGNHQGNELWDLWFSRLPLSADLEESRNMLELLLRLLSKNTLGNKRLGQVLTVFLTAFSVPDLCDKDQKFRDTLVMNIRQIRSRVPHDALSGLVSNLSPNARRAFSMIK